MSNYIQEHQKLLNKLLNEPNLIIKDHIYLHEQQIKHLQVERKIHLLITLFIGLFALMAIFTTLITKNGFLLIVDLLLISLFVPYIFHYRFLENLVQKWYQMSLELTQKLGS